MKTKIYIFFLLILISPRLASQVYHISLEECQIKARDNYPLIRQYELLSQAEEYTQDNLMKNYLPQVVLNGQASYQSEVTKLPVKIPGMNVPMMDKDQYKVTLDVSQLIWDGGATRSQSQIAKARTELEKQEVEVSLYSIRDQVNQLYFGILTIKEQIKQLQILTNDLQTNYNLVSSMVKNGVAMVSDLELVQVELLNAEQKGIELDALHNAYLKMLSLFSNEPLDEYTEFQIPDDFVDFQKLIARPELAMYDKQHMLFDVQETSIKAKNMPKFSFFLQGGYGRPGLNMLESDFKAFAIGGIRLSWNFGNLYTRKNEERLIENDKNTADVQKQTFLFNTNIKLTQMQKEIQKYKKLMEKDSEIITLRNRVKLASESKYKNGIYKMNDWIGDINAENQARVTRSLHEMQYLLSIHTYKYAQGN
jgi:outer membrane protein TolC